MPKSWVADSGGVRREITDIVVGTATGNRVIEKAWAGSAAGVPLLVFDRFKMTTTITAKATSASQITVSWTATAGASYKLYRGSTNIYTGSLLTFNDTGLAASTEYEYRVDVIVGGKVVGSPSTKATTQATPPPPPPQFVQRSVDCGVVWWGSYNKNGLRTTNSDGSPISHMFYGNYTQSTNNGLQSSLVKFNIPDYVRQSGGCVSVDAVQVKWYNQHHYQNSGGQVSMVGHHWASRPGTFGGTGAMTHNGSQVRWPAPKPGWINNMGDRNPANNQPWEWYHVGFLRVAYSNVNRTINEEIHVAGLQGLGLVTAVSGSNGYGYAATDPVLRITYTVQV